MKDYELEQLTSWRFVPIDRGKKGPNVRDWQLKPYELKDIPQDKNIGVILGPTSGGILAVDFDGPWAWEFWLEHIQIPFETIDTVMWTSNRPGRCQMAFVVHPDFWPHMPKLFKINGPDKQGIEFRWGTDSSGCQSVLPPSIHPDNVIDPNINYTWLRKPSEVRVMEAPVHLLEWIYNYKIDKEQVETEVVKDIKYINDPDDIAMYAEQLKKYYPTLDYDTWIRVTWAFCDALGRDDGIAVMRYHYPEEKPGEYKKLLSSKYSGRRVTIGTVKKMIRDRGGMNYMREMRKERYRNTVDEMEQLRQILKEKQNGK